MKKKELMIYVHIPFCAKKCAYCDFLSGPANKQEISDYVKALTDEIGTYGEIAKDYEVTSVFFGGGTPSLLLEEQIQEIMKALKSVFIFTKDAEVSIECNPGTVTKEKLLTYLKIGFNRLSFGLQSTDNEELRLLGRIHTFEQFLENYHIAREVGFSNINIDLMSALPNQTVKSYGITLDKIIALKPEHISAYSLIIEEGTPFYDKYEDNQSALPSEAEDREMYHMTKAILKEAGYERYEISNYAKPGYACRHNIGYWKRKEYIGIGLGASSFFNKKRYHLEEDLKKYILAEKRYNSLCKDVHTLTKKEEMEEFMFLGLRMTEGIDCKQFHEEFGVSFEQVYGDIFETMADKGLLIQKDNKIALTEQGIDVSNSILSEFLLEN